MEGNDAKSKDNWKAVSAEKYSLSEIRVDERIVPVHNYYKYSVAGNVGTYDPEMYMIYNIESADDAYQTVLNNAGTINRDAIEKRIVNEARTGTAQYGGAAIGANKGIIDTENDCEGFIQYSTDYTVPADTDGDGIPDEWEKKHGLNPNVADQNLINGLGYTALEVYLNSLMGEELPDDFHTNSISNVKSVSALRYDRQSNNLFVSDNAIGAVLKVYSTEGKLLSTRSIASVKTSLSDVKQNVFIIRLEGSNITPRVLKLCK